MSNGVALTIIIGGNLVGWGCFLGFVLVGRKQAKTARKIYFHKKGKR